METTIKTDVIIVGAGPTGLSLAVQLMRYDIDPLYPRVVEIFGTSRPFQLLLRPDNYIGFISTEISVNIFQAYLDELVERKPMAEINR